MMLTASGFAQLPAQDPLNAIKQTIPFIDSAYRAFADAHHSPGLAYAVVYGGDVIHVGTIGLANVEERVPVSSQSVFRIASMTKSFVAAAIVQLRDAGKLRLDDPVVQYIPEFKNQPLPTADAPTITIRHLLTHTSGLPEDDPWGDRLLDMREDAFYEAIKAGFSFSNTPGVKYEYSNTPFALLGEIIHRVSGQPFDTYVSHHILAPLGMHDTYWEYTEVPGRLLAKGYRWERSRWEPQPMLGNGVYGAMGGMLTTLGDFAKYMVFHLQAWPPRDGVDDAPLKRASLREMQSPWVFNTLTEFNGGLTSFAYGYALRWTRDAHQVTTVGHTGGLPGFGSNWLVLPDYGLGLVCFSNVTYAPAANVNTYVATEVIKRTGLTPRPVSVSPILKKRQEELMTFLPHWEGAASNEVFSGNFFLDNDITLLRERCQAIFAEAGKVIEVGNVTPQNNLRGTFTIECENHDISVFFSLNPEQTPRIQELSIQLVSDR